MGYLFPILLTQTGEAGEGQYVVGEWTWNTTTEPEGTGYAGGDAQKAWAHPNEVNWNLFKEETTDAAATTTGTCQITWQLKPGEEPPLEPAKPSTAHVTANGKYQARFKAWKTTVITDQGTYVVAHGSGGSSGGAAVTGVGNVFAGQDPTHSVNITAQTPQGNVTGGGVEVSTHPKADVLGNPPTANIPIQGTLQLTATITASGTVTIGGGQLKCEKSDTELVTLTVTVDQP